MARRASRRRRSADWTNVGAGLRFPVRRPRERRGPRLQVNPWPLGARRRGAGLGHGLPRRHRRQRRAARYRPRPGCLDQRPAMDSQRLRPNAGLVDPPRGLARRSLRPAAHLRPRRRGFHSGVASLCDRSDRRAARPREALTGRRRGPPDARQPGDDRGQLSPLRSGPRDRCVVGPRRRRDRDWAVAGRLPGRRRLVASDLSASTSRSGRWS